MPVDLAKLVANGRSAVLTMELQQGVVGEQSSFPELAEAVRRGAVIENASRLLRAARSADVPVVHCTAQFRADRRGSPLNSPLVAAMMKRPSHMVLGTRAVELMPEIGPETGDLVSPRSHGVSPFSGTNLDATLRALGVSTVVAVGVSINLAIVGLTIEAVNLGYSAVVPADAVAGVPAEYAQAVLRNTLSLVATITTVDEVVSTFAT